MILTEALAGARPFVAPPVAARRRLRQNGACSYPLVIRSLRRWRSAANCCAIRTWVSAMGCGVRRTSRRLVAPKSSARRFAESMRGCSHEAG
jgi:hypothetical protein